MTTNDSPLRAALDKVAALEFTEAEAEALKALLERGVESDDEVAGFGMSPLRDGRPFAVEISGVDHHAQAQGVPCQACPDSAGGTSDHGYLAFPLRLRHGCSPVDSTCLSYTITAVSKQAPTYDPALHLYLLRLQSR